METFPMEVTAQLGLVGFINYQQHEQQSGLAPRGMLGAPTLSVIVTKQKPKDFGLQRKLATGVSEAQDQVSLQNTFGQNQDAGVTRAAI